MATGNTAVVTATATPAATPLIADAATKTVIEAAMKKNNFNDVTVEATTGSVTLRGSVPKGKMGEAVRVAQEAGRKPVDNQLTEK
jgi:osmotically-inducible protein OsmY